MPTIGEMKRRGGNGGAHSASSRSNTRATEVNQGQAKVPPKKERKKRKRASEDAASAKDVGKSKSLV